MPKKIALAAIAAALLFLPNLAVSQEAFRCRESCAPGLRACLQEGRPRLRDCLRQCRLAAGGACPDGVDVEDCTEATGFQACVGACRDVRRTEIRTCVQGSTDCAKHCRPAPAPTATPTPR